MRNLLLAFFIAMCLVLITIPTTGAQPYSDNSGKKLLFFFLLFNSDILCGFVTIFTQSFFNI